MWDLSSPTRDQTCIPCIGRQLLNHWTTGEVPVFIFMFIFPLDLISNFSTITMDYWYKKKQKCMQKVPPWKFLNHGGLGIKSTCHLTCWEQFKDSFSGSSPFLVLQEGGPFQGPKLGSCLTLRNELSEETHVLTKQEILLGKGTRVESSRVREPRRTALPGGSQSRVLWDEMSFRVVFGQSFWLRVLPGGARTAQPIWMPAREILGSGRTRGVPFWPFPNASGWWWLISSVFLIRTSCPKTTHANDY